MSEIQMEEARIAALQAQQQGAAPRASSGWANVVAARSSVGPAAVMTRAGGVMPVHAQQPSALLTGVGTKPLATSKSAAGAAPKKLAVAATVPSQKPGSLPNAAASPLTTNSSGAASNAAEEFGAKMSPVFEKWCREQVKKINGTDDLTLVSFCMSLSDPSEIREYLTTYLGSTAQVNSFATDFIKRKNGMGGAGGTGAGASASKQQEEWESTAAGKKARKKKGAN
jgi:hypothetical protein